MKSRKITVTPRVIIQMLVFVVLVPFLPLLISHQWAWWEAWIYAAVNIFGFILSRMLAARHHPDLLAERARFLQHKDAQPWDKILAPLVGVGGFSVPCIAGLDKLFSWSPSFSTALKLIALAVILGGFAWGSYALVENRFFSGMVRIQSERGHQVVTSGPYRFMRHAGYAGALLTYLASPIFLDAYWAFIPAAVLTALLIIRTRLEDRYLKENLPGYAEYARRVRYRLIPGVW